MWFAVLVVLALLAVVVFFVMLTADRVTASIPVVPPPAHWKVDTSACSLFNFLPQLRGKIAWRPLGTYPTPLSPATLTLPNGKKRQLFLKREDLCDGADAAMAYTGNKVRTLEFQLACVAAHAPPGGRVRLMTLGAVGSNQTVAVVSQSRKHPEITVQALMALPEAAAIENGLNAFSNLSLFRIGVDLPPLFKLSVLLPLLRNMWIDRSAFVSPMGGANVPGALGHVAAALEVCAHVDPHRIVLASGSTCTASGLLVGIAIARKLGLGYKNFRTMHSVIIHPLFALGGAWIPRTQQLPPLVRGTAEAIRNLGGPDVVADVEVLMRDHWRAETGFQGEYGAPTTKSTAARALPLETHDGTPVPWLCDTFSSKAMAFLVDQLETEKIGADEHIVFWCTKTRMQPSDRDDVFDNAASPKSALDYVRECGIASAAAFRSSKYAKRI